MLGGMNLPRDPDSDRRTVPRHLRDSEHSMSTEIPGFGARAEDVPSSKTRVIVFAAVAIGAVVAALWYFLA